MEKWNYILREEIGEKDKEGRHVFLADRILSEAPREYGERVSEERTAGEKAYVTRMQRVVIKSTDCSSAYLRHTLTELNCLQELQHPGIPKVLEHYRAGKNYHLVLPYIEGDSLKKRLEENWTFDFLQIYSLLRQLGEILQYLHQQEPPVLYRDLKPEHILIDQIGQVCLLDFDGVILLGKAGDGIGNSRFSAPEQFDLRRKTDQRSDIYAFGKIAELLFRQIPEERRTENEQKKWSRFIKHCTRERPEKRYKDMEAVLRELQKLNHTAEKYG